MENERVEIYTDDMERENEVAYHLRKACEILHSLGRDESITEHSMEDKTWFRVVVRKE